MAGSLNKCTFIGNLGKDPEIRTLNNGNRVANFSLACSESWKDKSSGERKEKTEWVNIVVFNDGLVGVIEKYVFKGSKVYIEGAMQTRKWQDKDGADRWSTEIVLQAFNGQLILLGDRKGGDEGGGGNGGGGGRSGGSGGGQTQQRSSTPKDSFPADLDDEIPF